MKVLVGFIRIFVGVLFIFSGMVKANDPLGLSYKMQEFFDLWNLHALNSYSLWFAIFLNAFEIIAGVALIIRWNFKLTGWLLLLLILFFTALTGYTYWTGFPKNCGCFGDCLPISSQFSFYKDVLLLVLISLLLLLKRYQSSPSNAANRNWWILITVIMSFGFQFYALRYLPPVDCLPFKKESNLIENRKTPPDAIPDSTIILFTYIKEGKEVQFQASDFPADFNTDTYQFVRREDKLIKEGRNKEPLIKGFVLNTLAGEDSTDVILALPQVILIFNETAEALQSQQRNLQQIRALTLTKGVPAFVVSASPQNTRDLLNKMDLQGLPVLSCDLKAIQTAARANPCYYVVKKGIVVEKASALKIQKIWEAIESINP